MKFTILLMMLLSVTTLVAEKAEEITSIELINAELTKAKAQVADTQARLDEQESMSTNMESKITEQQAQLDGFEKEALLRENDSMHISVTGQGVAPMNTTSPAQAYALAKRAAVADAYRAIAEKIKGVRVDGEDLIKNMMVKRSVVRTSVKAMIRNANVVETTFKEGLCEVEMEIVISHSDFVQ